MALPPSKKRRVTSKGISPKQQIIKELENKLNSAISSSTSLNSLSDLLQLTNKLTDPLDVHKSIWALYRLFSRLVNEDRLFGLVDSVDINHLSTEAKIIRRWLSQKFGEYIRYLVSLQQDSEQTLRVSENVVMSRVWAD